MKKERQISESAHRQETDMEPIHRQNRKEGKIKNKSTQHHIWKQKQPTRNTNKNIYKAVVKPNLWGKYMG